MADAREVAVWTGHAGQQLAQEAYKAPSGAYKGDAFAAALATEPWGAVLDFGCGTGLWRDYFRAGAYVGLDQNPAMIDGARQRWGGDFEDFVLCQGVSDGARMPFDDGSFGLVFTSAVLQHNSDADKAKVLSEIHRVLRTGGRFIFYENTWDGDHPDASDGYSHTRPGWERLLASHGFTIIGGERDFYVFRAV